MKRFLLFHGDACYPRGGMEDFQGSFDTFDDAREAYFKATEGGGYGRPDWGHVYDAETSECRFFLSNGDTAMSVIGGSADAQS